MPDQPPRPTLAVIIPATDRPPTLGACVAALGASEQPPDELIVVDDPRNGGPAAARNAGVARTTADLIAFVDADVCVHADALVRLRAAFAADPGLTAVFGAYDARPAAPGLVSRFRNLLHHHVHVSSAGEARTFWAGLGAVRREAFTAVGGFDAGRFPESSVEDIELGMRLHGAGASIVLEPEIRGTHLKRWSLGGMVRTDLTRRGIPWIRLRLESGGPPPGLNLAWRHRLTALAVLAVTAGGLARRPLAAAGGLAAMLALNAGFYRLLGRRGGLRLALAGLPLHVVHHLVSVTAALSGSMLHLRERGR